MLRGNKQPFWHLCLIFGSITLLIAGLSLGYGQNQINGMMSDSMGNMMKTMELSEVTIQDIIRQYEPSVNGQDQEHSGHHDEAGSMKMIHDFSISTIVLLLPLILAGSLFLTIAWFGTNNEKGGEKK